MSKAAESVTKQIWLQAKAGDVAARERLFSLHSDRLLLFIRARLGEQLRAKLEPDDVLQDAYWAAFRRFDDFQYTDDGAFLRWMCRIIDNRLRDAHDYFTAQKRRPEWVAKSAPTGPLTAVQRSEQCERLEAALLRLAPEHREVVLLRYFQGFSAEEAGQQMGRTAGAIRSLAARALTELGKQIQSQQEP